VLTNVIDGSDILREEIFGPVLAVIPFDDEDEAVGFANSTEYGVVSYVFTEDPARAMRMIDAIETGMMGINVGAVSNAASPFGGVRCETFRYRPRGWTRGDTGVPIHQVHPRFSLTSFLGFSHTADIMGE
jgi:acyl-CoA reductase-like NAD-dependent aldehyde dehydrogenase